MTILWIVATVVVSVLFIYAVLLALVAWISVRPPRMPQFVTPGLMGEEHDTLSIGTSDGLSLRAWWVPCEGETTAIFAHGYFTNRCEFVPFVTRFKARKVSSLLFDHRAHGTSTGKICTFGVDEVLDVQAAVNWVKQQRPGQKIVLVGNSMGALACALYAAQEPEGIHGLILDSPYARVDEGARGWWSFFARGRFKHLLRPTAMFGKLFCPADLGSIDLEHAVAKIRDIPMIFMFGEHDPLISKEKTERCLQAAGPMAKVVWFPDANHARARFREPEKYAEALFSFLEDNKLGEKPTSPVLAP